MAILIDQCPTALGGAVGQHGLYLECDHHQPPDVPVSPGLSFDLAAFYTTERYSLTESEVSPDTERYGNGESVKSYRGEDALNRQVSSWWRLRPTRSVLQVDSQIQGDQVQERSGQPTHQAALRSLMNLTETVELDASDRFVDRIAAFGIHHYHNLDIRVGWRPKPAWELSLIGHNLVDRHHQGFLPGLINTQPTAVHRGVYGKIPWRF